jgi:hypothetical protein
MPEAPVLVIAKLGRLASNVHLSSGFVMIRDSDSRPAGIAPFRLAELRTRL